QIAPRFPNFRYPLRALLHGTASPSASARAVASPHEHGCWPTPGTAAERHRLHTYTAHISDASNGNAPSCSGTTRWQARDGVGRDSPGFTGARRAGTGGARAYGSDTAVPSRSSP